MKKVLLALMCVLASSQAFGAIFVKELVNNSQQVEAKIQIGDGAVHTVRPVEKGTKAVASVIDPAEKINEGSEVKVNFTGQDRGYKLSVIDGNFKIESLVPELKVVYKKVDGRRKKVKEKTGRMTVVSTRRTPLSSHGLSANALSDNENNNIRVVVGPFGLFVQSIK